VVEDLTRDATHRPGVRTDQPEPGLLLTWDTQGPAHRAFPLDRPTEIGRDAAAAALHVDDPRVSRTHCRVWRERDQWQVCDLESRNGTFVDGEPCGPEPRSGRILRVGQHVFVLSDDLRVHELGVDVRDGVVCGGNQRRVRDAIGRAARSGGNLLILGESGAGKERAARHFHTAGGGAGPFIAVNCATIPPGVAERLLFGSRRGAFSGATDAIGYLEEASGGVLFLDEIAELDQDVQAKLLRVLETGELLRLGATKATKVDLKVCTATHQALRDQVSAGKFRADLYYRIGRPEVVLPPLRERPEEIGWLVQLALDGVAPSLRASAELVEACLVRPWPGNIRELLTEVRFAAQTALDADRDQVTFEDLPEHAGRPLETPSAPMSSGDPLSDPAAVEAAMQRNGGNVSATARELGVHRTQLRRFLAKRQDAET
jgi:transcriptional regulator of acetoin/glycerol metabolism